MAIYGRDDSAGVIAAHRITTEQLEYAQRHSVYKAEYTRVESLLATPHSALRVKAENLLPGHIDVINAIATDKYQPATARLKAVEMSLKLAGMQAEEKQQSGVVVNIDFGGFVPTHDKEATVVITTDSEDTGAWRLLDA